MPLDLCFGGTECASHAPASRLPQLRGLCSLLHSSGRCIVIVPAASVRYERGAHLSPFDCNRSHAPVEVKTEETAHEREFGGWIPDCTKVSGTDSALPLLSKKLHCAGAAEVAVFTSVNVV